MPAQKDRKRLDETHNRKEQMKNTTISEKMLTQPNMATAYYEGLKRSINGQQSRHAKKTINS